MIIKYVYDPYPGARPPKSDDYWPYFADGLKDIDCDDFKGKTIYRLDIDPKTRQGIIEIDE